MAHELLARTHDPRVMGGRPCLRGMRVTVGTIVGEVQRRLDTEDYVTRLEIAVG